MFRLHCSSSVQSKQLHVLCFVHSQGQKSEQKHTTKNFARFHNYFPLTAKIRIDKDCIYRCYRIDFRPTATGNRAYRCYCDLNTEANSSFQENKEGCFTSNDAISSSVLPLKIALAKESLTSRYRTPYTKNLSKVIPSSC